MLNLQNVSGGYGKSTIIKNINLSLQKGEIFGILGPNGSGKTTLLKLMNKQLSPTGGQIFLHDRPLHSFRAKELAKVMAVLPQIMDTSFTYSVRETVELGRYAHQNGWFTRKNKRDEEVVFQALRHVHMLDMKSRSIQSLSGGERQRVFLARALAQEPELLLLDEPTNHLDISHQIHLFDLLKKLTKEKKLTVISIFHDMNLASLYCNRVLLLKEGKQLAVDHPDTAFREELLSDLYQTELIRTPHPAHTSPIITFLPKA